MTARKSKPAAKAGRAKPSPAKRPVRSPTITKRAAKKAPTAKLAPNRKPAPGRGSKPGERRGGRRKGTPNKTTATMKQALVAVYADLQAARRREQPELGDNAHFHAWAMANPTEFYKMMARLLPLQVDVEAGPTMAKALRWLPPKK